MKRTVSNAENQVRIQEHLADNALYRKITFGTTLSHQLLDIAFVARLPRVEVRSALVAPQHVHLVHLTNVSSCTSGIPIGFVVIFETGYASDRLQWLDVAKKLINSEAHDAKRMCDEQMTRCVNVSPCPCPGTD